jgi:hypothetical protein
MPQFLHIRSLVFPVEMVPRWRGSTAEPSATVKAAIAQSCADLEYATAARTPIVKRVFRYRAADEPV